MVSMQHTTGRARAGGAAQQQQRVRPLFLRRRSRGTPARCRGAALIEGLVVAAACLALLALGLAVYAHQTRALERERAVRFGAWRLALAGCEGGKRRGADPRAAVHADTADGIVVRGQSLTERVAALAHAALQGRASAEAERQALTLPPPTAGASSALLAPCNEPPAPLDAELGRAQGDLARALLESP